MRWPWLLLAAAVAVAALPLREARARVHLVQWGWDEPDTAYLRAHAPRMAGTPFDGCVFHAGSLAWKSWGRTRVPPASLYPAIKDLRATRFSRFRHNFLRVNVTPGDLDWFDDHEALLANLRLASQVAAAGGDGVRGIALDTEAYEHLLFCYPRQPQASRHTFGEYQAQARKRGREVMAALRSSYPDLTVLVTFGHTLARFEQRMRGGAALETLQYGLLPAFLDGLVDGAGRGQVVDGYELSYAFRSEEQFRAARDDIRAATFAADPRRYRRVVRTGFGLWMDDDWRRRGWPAEDPAAFRRGVEAARRLTDGYVWIYMEQPRIWTPDGVPKDLPPAFLDALRPAP